MQDYRNKLRQIRKDEGLTQSELAKELSISVGSIRNYESGFRDIGLSIITKFTRHPHFKKYTLWLMTGDLSAASEQIAPASVPGEKNDDQ